jgi:uncharacterized membrane protein
MSGKKSGPLFVLAFEGKAGHNYRFNQETSPMYDYAKLLHLIAGIVWLGGMTFMLFALRPAAISTMDAQSRAVLMGQVWKRFFALVLAAIVLLFTTGTHLYTATFRATRLATGEGGVPLGWNIMLVLGLLMMLIFGHIYFAGFKKYKRTVAAAQWPLAAKAAGLIHTMTLINFTLGWLAIIAVRLVR